MALLQRSLQALHEQAKIRPPGYVDDVLRHVQRVDDAHYWIDPQAYLNLCQRWQTTPPRKPPKPRKSRPSRSRQFVNLIGSAARATRSVARTSLGIHRATDEQVEARLNICRQCPGNHGIWKHGDVHTCGPMLASMKGQGEGTCGCILRRKARDLTEDCPFGWWPKPATGTHGDTG